MERGVFIKFFDFESASNCVAINLKNYGQNDRFKGYFQRSNL